MLIELSYSIECPSSDAPCPPYSSKILLWFQDGCCPDEDSYIEVDSEDEDDYEIGDYAAVLLSNLGISEDEEESDGDEEGEEAVATPLVRKGNAYQSGSRIN